MQKGCGSDLNKYRIAVIVAGIDEKYQSSILHGIESAAAGCMLDLAMFASFSGTMGNPIHDSGEYNIFRLPDFSTFDGAILLTNTIDDKSVVEDIRSRIRAAGIPAVSIDDDVKDMYYIGIDNKTAMRKMAEHFIKVHGFTKFNYISGPAENPESKDRLRGFLEVLEEHGLTLDDNRIYYGDFRAPAGKAAVDYFLKNNSSLPEAIVCANDVMAASAINRLFEAGITVPGQIAVSGFDNIYNNHNFRIELTSVERPFAYSGQLACEKLFNHFNGIAQERAAVLDMFTRFTESCGCSDSAVSDIAEYKELNIANYSRVERISGYMSQFNKLSCTLQGCGTFDDYITSIKEFIKEIDPEEFYFCLCKDWNIEHPDEHNFSKKSEVPTRYTDEMFLPIVYYKGEFRDDVTSVPTKELIPHLEKERDAGRIYYMVPLHFGERCLGYMAMCNCKVHLYNALFQSWCITMSNSLENIRKIISLEYAVERLGKLYTQDTFSGIYNRNGFVRATKAIYDDCVRNSRSVMLMFIDLDGLKTINDTYGHDVGDDAIRSISGVLRSICKKGEVYCRFGGDEFIVFAADSNEKVAEELTDRIQSAIEVINESMENPFSLSASIGFTIAKPKAGEDLFRFVTEADKVMYEQKRKKKLSNYLKK